MPTPDAILAQLAEIAEAGFELAFVLHVAVASAIVLLLSGWRPTQRVAGVLAVAPLATASAMAFIFRNPFNGVALGAVALSLGALGLRAPQTRASSGPPWASALGGALLAYAFLYPHFLELRPVLAYVIGAPMGLVPCPSLALAISILLLADLPSGRVAGLVASAAGGFYALFGALRLGVWLDLGLLAGALGLLLLTTREAIIARGTYRAHRRHA